MAHDSVLRMRRFNELSERYAENIRAGREPQRTGELREIRLRNWLDWDMEDHAYLVRTDRTRPLFLLLDRNLDTADIIAAGEFVDHYETILEEAGAVKLADERTDGVQMTPSDLGRPA